MRCLAAWKKDHINVNVKIDAGINVEMNVLLIEGLLFSINLVVLQETKNLKSSDVVIQS